MSQRDLLRNITSPTEPLDGIRTATAMALARASCLLLLLFAGALGAPPPPSTPSAATPETSQSPESLAKAPRIVGGVGASLGELPYMVSLQDTSFGSVVHFCGGAIYDHTHVVTAAHCVSSVVAGETDLSVTEGTEQPLQVASILLHPDFREIDYFNDIALLKLSGKFVFNEFVQPVQMPGGREASGSCVVSGWGATRENGDMIDLLKKVSVPVWTDSDCRQIYGAESILDSMVCAGLEEGGKDACHGDSGSPLMCYDSGSEAFFAGVMSWGYGCARPDRPSVYSEVSHFSNWLEQNI
ncbi:trypsin [Penaeus vannamei]|uniref:limulus clotting factor C n=1 Tax=Penaeus vannamei TaxID=6689 RepID=A0A3R7LVK5_PENVA|nr:trypsin [Penaeus vannamei]